MMADQFLEFWDDQRQFMQLLVEKRGFPQFPLDMNEKESQRFIKSIIQDAAHELHETIGELRNSKRHRAANIQDFDRDAYLEEIVDTYKFLLEILILSGISIDEFRDAFFKKSKINIERINEGY